MKIGLTIVFLACMTVGTTAGGEQWPDFIGELIESYETETRGLVSPVEIWRYEYQGEQVFYVPLARSLCCDIPSVLYSVNGDLICRPDGGFAGGGDGRCPDFVSQRGAGVLVWRGASTAKVPSDEN